MIASALLAFVWGIFTGACLVLAVLAGALLVMVRCINGICDRAEDEPLLSRNYPNWGHE